ncbi:MAG: putative toxin-antitoxin system toxin component, PIN family [Candidatus Latescibacteria bacterium]|nr:putative toxin-antitoxin system toxin component, PIN family [Candidatus Latescibacterota bacterium]
MPLPKVVLDVNICVRGLITRGSAYEIVFGQASRYVLYLSDFLLSKIAEVAHRPHIFEKYHLNQEKIDHYIQHLRDIGHVIPVITVLDVVSDPEDNQILACAVDAGADYLVTGDPHFDPLQGRYQKVLILDPVTLLRIVRSTPLP